jgi:hypothetical protein
MDAGYPQRMPGDDGGIGDPRLAAPAIVRGDVLAWAATTLAQPTRVRSKSFHSLVAPGLGAFFLGMLLLALVANGFSAVLVLAGLPVFAFLAFFHWLMNRARRHLVASFDSAGIVRGDGLRLPWNDPVGVDWLMAWGSRRRLCLQRVELVFAKGTAWVIFQRVGNEDEIGKLAARIPGRHQERMMGAF